MYSQGQLPALPGFRVWLHVRSCSSCRERAQEFAAVASTMRGLLAPPGAARVAPPRVNAPKLQWIAVGAAAAVFAVGLAQLFASNDPPKRPPVHTVPSIGSDQACTNCHTPHEVRKLQQGASSSKAEIHSKLGRGLHPID
ncbi:MAG: hypothetical protein ACOYON_06690 [Fimbriimonas sp.]